MPIPMGVTALLQVPMPPMIPGPEIPIEAVAIVKSFFLTIAVIALGIPVIRALSRRFLERPPVAPLVTGDIVTRLERIEQAVDAMSLEVERISENQRYVTKLLAEGRPAGQLAAGASAPARPGAGNR